MAYYFLLGVEDMASLLGSVADSLPKENLRQAFELFNEMSQQLSESYSNLESQVQVLSGELAEVSAARIKELKEKEQLADRLHSLLHLLPGGVVVLDGKGRVQECNLAAKNFFQNQDVIGLPWRNIISSNFCPKEDDGHEVSLKSGLRLSIQTSSLENEPGQIVLMTDQTETRMLQDKLARNQRLTAMGKMVASLAHQVRTPLSGATLYAQHLASSELDDDMRVTFSKKLSRQLKNIEAQVRDMLIFARGSAPLNQLIDILELANLLGESKAILQKQYQADISIIKDIETASSNNLEKIQCHQESLIGAIQNLLANGIEAAEDINELAKIKVVLSIQDKNLTITISDNGPGLSETVKEKITEPFYTTKSNGTGLGLSVVKAVVRAHHGRLGFYNQVQGGACFVLTVPLKNSVNTVSSKEMIDE